MRTIRKGPSPTALTGWRQPRMAQNRPPGMECTYAELRRDVAVTNLVEQSLIREQGRLCAYTGRPIATGAGGDLHLEHLLPQAYCEYGEDADYRNLVACWPRPNCGFEPRYGARRKGDWPARVDQGTFVSPLRADCTTRFSFNLRGEVFPHHAGDEAVQQTIERLGLDDSELTALRKNAIQGALSPRGAWLTLPQCRRLITALDRIANAVDNGSGDALPPYWFALRSAVRLQIRRLGGQA